MKQKLPLEEKTIEQLFIGGEKSVYEIPIYQRNYAWEKDEITALVQDVYDAWLKGDGKPYYIGTLVTYHKGDHVYEVIDGQQRITTLRLILSVLGIQTNSRLTYRARRKSDETLKNIPEFNNEEKDSGIENGYWYAKAAIGDIVPENELHGFKAYFMSRVHIIHYQVPKDIDLNHYFEIMNSRGEQLEKHEIVKVNLMERLKDEEERKVFSRIWESCAEMRVYVQQNLNDINADDIFGRSLYEFIPQNFSDIMQNWRMKKKEDGEGQGFISIRSIIRSGGSTKSVRFTREEVMKDSFLPIIDFPNFLLIVLKIARMEEPEFEPAEFILDDKELLNEFRKAFRDPLTDEDKVKRFAYILLKTRFYLDNYIVHHSKEEDTMDSNPWKLQVWHRDRETRKAQLKNLTENRVLEDRLTHLLSMFEVSFTARQRKNYLFYCLFYLLEYGVGNISEYARFMEELADRYIQLVYLDGSKLNAINTPRPGSFDEAILDGHALSKSSYITKDRSAFIEIYGDGTEASRGIPLFIYNYLDYKLWKLYDESIRGKEYKETTRERQAFFSRLGCSDFGLNVFDQFYFSRTRRSLEHYYPQANASGIGDALNKDQINCFGNYAMIGSEANSSGSNWSPKTKLDHYLDSSGKINQVSVASLKFMIMMQICKEHQDWGFEEIQDHQDKMIALLL